jgi:hypothetical protein
MVSRGLVLVFHCITDTAIAYSHARAEFIKRNIKMLQHIKKKKKKSEKDDTHILPYCITNSNCIVRFQKEKKSKHKLSFSLILTE